MTHTNTNIVLCIATEIYEGASQDNPSVSKSSDGTIFPCSNPQTMTKTKKFVWNYHSSAGSWQLRVYNKCAISILIRGLDIFGWPHNAWPRQCLFGHLTSFSWSTSSSIPTVPDVSPPPPWPRGTPQSLVCLLGELFALETPLKLWAPTVDRLFTNWLLGRFTDVACWFIPLELCTVL